MQTANGGWQVFLMATRRRRLWCPTCHHHGWGVDSRVPWWWTINIVVVKWCFRMDSLDAAVSIVLVQVVRRGTMWGIHWCISLLRVGIGRLRLLTVKVSVLILGYLCLIVVIRRSSGWLWCLIASCLTTVCVILSGSSSIHILRGRGHVLRLCISSRCPPPGHKSAISTCCIWGILK